MPGTTFEEDFGPKAVVLRNGVKMPILGLGTSHSGGYSQSAVVYALQSCNYHLIDTAKRYGCEELLQKAICESEVPREELFLTSKLWCTDYGLLSTRKAFIGSLKRLGIDYIDLFMLHWPLCHSSCENKKKTLEDTWRILELLYDEGFCRSIGVSNYSIADLESLLETSTISPHVNQVEFHPFQNPRKLRRFCKENKIQIEGYCPLGKGQILNEEPVVRIARYYGRTPAQILIRWSIQVSNYLLVDSVYALKAAVLYCVGLKEPYGIRFGVKNGVVTIPKSTKEKRVKENSQVFDFKLSENDMHILNNLHENRRYVDISNIQDKIDKCLPDGYKLRIKYGDSDKLGYRNHS